jgi:hypothetical protein
MSRWNEFGVVQQPGLGFVLAVGGVLDELHRTLPPVARIFRGMDNSALVGYGSANGLASRR